MIHASLVDLYKEENPGSTNFGQDGGPDDLGDLSNETVIPLQLLGVEEDTGNVLMPCSGVISIG